MATYKEIKGVTIQTLDSDPVVNVGSFSSGGDLNTARGNGVGYGNTSATAGLATGYMGPPGITAANENYNGTAWTEVGDVPAANGYNQGGGTQTAALVKGGDGRPANPVLFATLLRKVQNSKSLKQNPETDYFMLINIKMRLDDLIKSAEIKLEQI